MRLFPKMSYTRWTLMLNDLMTAIKENGKALFTFSVGEIHIPYIIMSRITKIGSFFIFF